MSRDLGTLSADLFAPLVGADFALRVGDGSTLTVRLSHCVTHPRATMVGSPRTAFGLEFERPAKGVPSFTGGDFVLSHPDLGEIGPLYVERILPTGYGPNTAVFQIVFN
ncbi:DUF6916 family protein [Methylobacterium gossipiicola]|uniref:DUF6916 domain-containing protein n=1 Tax=Methylobacterium gossipiicola TaxID=582675 RepID=A0A1I2VHE4_9HYPH|nr:hypothetical protein [Methylobacterium gossipiicola]SFG86896.1 hypothetical protein SAMN05192565_11459 [Methylobacterium gossipiicola]